MNAIALKSFIFDRMTNEEFVAFCLEQRDLKIERTAEGEIIIIPPTYSKTGRINLKIARQLANWSEATQLGEVFDSSTGFTLPNGAMRSPDASWIARERWEGLTDAQQNSFAPICPDFIIELKSESDTIRDLTKKMEQDWLGNGCRLGWLIDPHEEKVYVFRADGSRQTINGFDQVVSGEAVLPGFELQLKELKS
jgi:Uma2 family endonuclease